MEKFALSSHQKHFCIIILQFALIIHVIGEDVEVENSNPYESCNRIIFDVTKLVQNKSDLSTKFKFRSVYYSPNDQVKCWNDFLKKNVLNRKCPNEFFVAELSFLFQPHNIKSTNVFDPTTSTKDIDFFIKNKSAVYAVVYSLVKNKQAGPFEFTCERYYSSALKTFDSINIALELTRPHKKLSDYKPPVKRGIEYDQRIIQYCTVIQTGLLQKFDLAVLRIEISSFDDLISYGIFSKKIDKIIGENQEFVRNYNPNCKIYVRLLVKIEIKSLTVQNKYKTLLAQYVRAWTVENPSDIIVILEGYPFDTKILDNIDMLRNRVSPIIKSDFNPWSSPNCSENVLLCNNKGLISSISSIFSSTEVSNNLLYSLCSSTKKCLKDVNVVSPINTMAVFDVLPTNNNIKLISLLADNRRRFKLQTIYFRDLFGYFNYSNWNETAQFLESRNIRAGCYVRVTPSVTFTEADILEEINESCKSLLTVSSEVICKFNVTPKNVSSLLLFINQIKQTFQKMYSGKSFIPAISLRHNIEQNAFNKSLQSFHFQTHRHKKTLLFCNAQENEINEYYSGILTFASIHNWTRLHLRHSIGDATSTGWWQEIIPNNEYINRTIADFAVTIRTNDAKPISPDKQLPFTYPCIIWSSKPIDTDIPFLSNKYSGTTFNIDMKDVGDLTPLELEILLLFVFGKFLSVELRVQRESDWHLISGVILNKRFLDTVRIENNTSVFIEMPINLASQILNVNLYFTGTAFHFTEWEEYNSLATKDDNFSNFLNMLKMSNVKIGVSVSDCAYEINQKLARLTNRSSFSEMNYLVCNTPPVLPKNVDQIWMDNYLNTMFYIKKYFEAFSTKHVGPDKDFGVYLRLNLISDSNCKENGKENTSDFLRFLNHVNQHSLAYHVNYFIVKAFENETSNSECAQSWWRLENYNDLSNTTVFFDKEDEYFGRPTKLTMRFVQEELKDDLPISAISKNYTKLIILVFVISFFLILVVTVFVHKHQQSFKRFLTEREVNVFFNGDENIDNTTNANHWLNKGFPKSHRVTKSKIKIGRLISKGRFSQVFNGTLNESVNVAIKTIEKTRSKEIFQDFLNEVKTLHYLDKGKNPNVIKFLGAYTREILNGKLFILTEYCANGTLQAYLRQNQSEEGGRVIFYELYKFACQIASGMDYICRKGVCHGELCSRNVFLDGELNCKIGGFGSSLISFENIKFVESDKEPLSWRWMAIETLKNMDTNVWSYGVTLWEIFSLGALPYPGVPWSLDFVSQLENGLRMNKAKLSSSELHEKLLLCWNKTKDERPTFLELEAYFEAQIKAEFTAVLEQPLK